MHLDELAALLLPMSGCRIRRKSGRRTLAFRRGKDLRQKTGKYGLKPDFQLYFLSAFFSTWNGCIRLRSEATRANPPTPLRRCSVRPRESDSPSRRATCSKKNQCHMTCCNMDLANRYLIVISWKFFFTCALQLRSLWKIADSLKLTSGLTFASKRSICFWGRHYTGIQSFVEITGAQNDFFFTWSGGGSATNSGSSLANLLARCSRATRTAERDSRERRRESWRTRSDSSDIT